MSVTVSESPWYMCCPNLQVPGPSLCPDIRIGGSHKKTASRFRMELKGRIMVYSIVGCPHCMQAKNSLHELGLDYVDVSLETFPQCRAELKQRTGRNTVPQIFFNSIHIGGSDALQKLVSTGIAKAPRQFTSSFCGLLCPPPHQH